jgi:hypothetical protein
MLQLCRSFCHLTTRTGLATGLALAGSLGFQLQAIDNTNARNHLPAKTLVAVEVPDGAAAGTALATTKVGQWLLDEARWQPVLKILQSYDQASFEEFDEELEEIGLSTAQLPQLLNGPAGFAVLVEKAFDGFDDLDDQATGYVWLTPAAEISEEILAEISEALADEQRVDHEMAGHTVIEIVPPQAGDPAENLDDDEWDPSSVLQPHLLMVLEQDGVRLLVSPPTTESDAALGRMQAWLSGSGDLLADAAQRPSSDSLYLLRAELHAQHLPPLVSEEDREEFNKFWSAFGLDSLTSSFFDMYMDNSVLRQKMHLGLPAPRQGMMRLWDMAAIDPAPAPWAPANATAYSHFATDMPLLYELIGEMVIALGGEEARQEMMEYESMMPIYAGGVTLPALLDAFGPRIGMLDDGLEAGNYTQRLGIVWDLRDPAVFKQLFQALKPFAAGMPFLEFVEEQGIPGLRFTSPASADEVPVTGGFFIHPQYLVFGMGDGMIEELLAAVNNPNNGLAQTDLPDACATVLPPVPGLMQQYADFGKHYADLMPVMQEMFRQLLQDEIDATEYDPDWDDPEYAAELEREREALEALMLIYDDLFPEDSFWLKAFGVVTGYVIATSDGVVLESATELDPTR